MSAVVAGLGPVVQTSVALAGVGMGGYGIYSAAASGDWAGVAIGGLTLALSATLLAYGLYVGSNAPPTEPPVGATAASNGPQVAHRGARLPGDPEFWRNVGRAFKRPGDQAKQVSRARDILARNRAMATARTGIPEGERVTGLLLESGLRTSFRFEVLAVPATSSDAMPLMNALNARGYIATTDRSIVHAIEVTLVGTNPDLSVPQGTSIGRPTQMTGVTRLYYADGFLGGIEY